MQRIDRARVSATFTSLVLLTLTACGGGYGGSGPGTPTAAVNIAVSPTTAAVGQTVTLSWNSNASACTANGAWTGPQAASGSMTVTPAAVGSQTFGIDCTGGGYTSTTATAVLTTVPPSAFTQTVLVADQTGGPALHVDPNLVNPWGVVIQAAAPSWLSNNGTQTSTLYDGAGNPRPATPLVVTLAPNGAVNFEPTGIVANPVTATDFLVSAAGKSGGASFIFSGEGGMIAGWAPAVDGTHAITVYTDTGAADYKGLAIAKKGAAAFLYATDFHNRKVDVFNNAYVKQTSSATNFTFSDPSIPATYAPYGIQAFDNGAAGATQIYVTYAQQLSPANIDEVRGAGLGYVDIYDTNGQLIKQLVAAGGKLNAPWGLALAPANFGTLSGALLVANFGDGRINGYNAATGAFVGALSNQAGTALVAAGLWGLAFGNDANNQPRGALFYTAGPQGQTHGAYGRYDLGTSPPPLGTAPTATIVLPASPLTGTVSLSGTGTGTAGAAIAKLDYYTGTTLIGSATAAPYTVSWDTTKVVNGTVPVRSVATDANGNVGSSAIANVTVSN